MQGRYEVSPRRSSGKPLTLRGVLCYAVMGLIPPRRPAEARRAGKVQAEATPASSGARLFYRVARLSSGLTDYYEICLNPGTGACLASSPSIYLNIGELFSAAAGR